MCIIIMLNQWQKWVPKSFTVHFVAPTLVYQFRLDWVKSQQRLARLTGFHLVFDFAIRSFFCARDTLPAADNINIWLIARKTYNKHESSFSFSTNERGLSKLSPCFLSRRNGERIIAGSLSGIARQRKF